MMIAAISQLEGYSLEVTARDAGAIGAPSSSLPAGMARPVQIFVPYLPDESDAARIQACAAIRAAGFAPVPHLPARRLTDFGALDGLLGTLREQAQADALFLIAGDVKQAAGPFADSLAVIRSGLFEAHGFRHVGIAGHPDGHPVISEPVLWAAMQAKITALSERGLETQIVTQFSFDADRVRQWLRAVRARGVTAPVRIGIPGPASARTLLRYAARCGVGASAGAMAKYGLSLSRLLGQAGPDAFLAELAEGLSRERPGDVRLHIFPFGGFSRLAEWMNRYTGQPSRAA